MTQEELKSILHYDDETGIFTWKVNRAQKIVGDIAGSIDPKDGYIRLMYKKKHYFVHRLAFLYMEGYIPEYVDHKDGNRINNIFTNLRPATLIQNQGNKKINSNNTSGHKGVVIEKQKMGSKKPFKAQIYKNGKKVSLGCYATAEEASAAYNAAANEYFGEYAKLNDIKS